MGIEVSISPKGYLQILLVCGMILWLAGLYFENSSTVTWAFVMIAFSFLMWIIITTINYNDYITNRPTKYRVDGLFY